MKQVDKLKQLCGLEPNELAEVLENNPRAYMAVKGAVAEKHLDNYFMNLKDEGKISSFRMAQNDFEKDFYVTLIDGREVIIECKNVEVLKINTKADYLSYFKFLQSKKGLFEGKAFKSKKEYTSEKLKKQFNSLPQRLKESGIPRYEFSENQITNSSIHEGLEESEFLDQFKNAPLTIDFQRTRNSRDDVNSGEDSKAARFYKLDEIDVVGACLFTRTLKWEFVFGSRESLIVHKDYENRYSNRLKLDPQKWHYNFLDTIK